MLSPFADFDKKFPSCTNLVIFTGSGASAGSGIPTFRGGSNAWYEGFLGFFALPIMATGFGWKYFPTICWFFYDWFMRGRVLRAFPNAFHRWTREFQDDSSHNVIVITQNVDGLHQKSLIKKENVFELHGSLWNSACSNPLCGEMFSEIEPKIILASEEVPHVGNCPKCGSGPRPGAVLFYDNLNHSKHSKVPHFEFTHLRKENTVVLIVGLSGMVGSSDYYIEELVKQCGRDAVFVVDPNETRYAKRYNWIPCKAEDFPDEYRTFCVRKKLSEN